MPLDEASVAAEAGEELTTRRAAKRHKHGRRPLPEHLPRIDIEHDLDDAEKACPACGQLRADRAGSERAARIPAGVVQGAAAHPAQIRLSGVRARRLQSADRGGGQARAADRQGLAGAGPAGLRGHEQVGRPPAAVPPGAHLRAAAGADRAEHDVRVDAGGRRVGPPAGDADGQSHPQVACRAYGRHAGARAVARRREVPQGAAVGLSGRCGQPVHRLRLHAQPRGPVRPIGSAISRGFCKPTLTAVTTGSITAAS